MTGLCLEDVSLAIGGFPVCEGFSHRFNGGQVYGVLGPNGVGKSSFIRVLAGLGRAQRGRVLLLGHKLEDLSRREISRHMGLLPQEAAAVDGSSVGDWVMAGRFPHISRFAQAGESDHAIVQQALDKLGLNMDWTRPVSTLSGGERQRLALAALYAQTPRVYLLDEPTNHLDLGWQHRIMNQLVEISRRELATVLVVLQDINLAGLYCDELVLLKGKGQVACGRIDDLVPDLELAYGQALLRIEDQGHWALVAKTECAR